MAGFGSLSVCLLAGLVVVGSLPESVVADSSAARALLQVYECEEGYTYSDGECVKVVEEYAEGHEEYSDGHEEYSSSHDEPVECYECTTQHCLDCDCLTGLCVECHPGYLLEDHYCKEVVYVEEPACHPCPDHCYDCSCEGECLACNAGYVYEAGHCTPTAYVPEDCRDNDRDNCQDECRKCRCGVCVECSRDYALYNGNCYNTAGHCEDDDDDDDGCPDHCDDCKCGVCQKCKGDRLLYDGLCYEVELLGGGDDDDDDNDR